MSVIKSNWAHIRRNDRKSTKQRSSTLNITASRKKSKHLGVSPTTLHLSKILKNEVIGNSTGTVFKALRSNGDLIAIKPIKFDYQTFHKERIDYLNKKINIISSLNCQNIIDYQNHMICIDDRDPADYIIQMKFVPGISIRYLLN